MLTRLLAAPAVLAAASLTATPAAAVELPSARHLPVEATSHYGPYAGSGWGWGRGHRGRHHRHGSTAGDILTGVLILGTIAAVASAAKRSERRPYPERAPFPDRRDGYRADGQQGLDGAADLCVREIERNARVREVTRVERDAGGWAVAGVMADGAPFTCAIGNDGRISTLQVGGRAVEVAIVDRQYDEEVYRSARAATGAATPDAGPQPAYPGGPLPGEELDDGGASER